jgi:hypothetical protein
MAIYHLSAHKPIARGAGKSAVRAAAYRAGARLVDERTGDICDYSRKGGVVGTALMLPGGDLVRDRGTFWNALEAHHKRGDAVLAREIVIALPHELDGARRAILARAFAQEISDRYGVALDLALHHKPGNEHAHMLMSACSVSADGTLGKKAVLMDPIHCQRHKLENAVDWMRERWEQLANEALAKAGSTARIDRRSHAEMDLEDEPTEHVGVGAGRGARAARNAAALARNKERVEIDAQLAALLTERAEETAREVFAASAEKARRVVRHMVGQDGVETAPAAVLAAPKGVASTLPRHPLSELLEGFECKPGRSRGSRLWIRMPDDELALVDTGRRIKLRLSDDSTMLAALQLAARRWERIEVRCAPEQRAAWIDQAERLGLVGRLTFADDSAPPLPPANTSSSSPRPR